MALTPRKKRKTEQLRNQESRSRAGSSKGTTPNTSRGPTSSATDLISRSPSSGRGRPKSRQGSKNAGRPSRLNSHASTPFLPHRQPRPRQLKFKQEHIEKIEIHMQHLTKLFKERPFPPHPSSLAEDSSVGDQEHCSDACDCSSVAQCQQNAMAFQAASKYMSQHRVDLIKPPKLRASPTHRCHPEVKNGEVQHIKCAAVGASHRVNFYDSGQFGDSFCEYCGARLLRGEAKQIKNGKKSLCCSNGEVHTELMQKEFEELQNPPVILGEQLTGTAHRENFLPHAMPLNNSFAFASVHSEAFQDENDDRKDTCKYNGEFSFLFSDLIAPNGKRPLFAQVYTLTPDEAQKRRPENLAEGIGKSKKIKAGIWRMIEELMETNPYALAFKTVGERKREIEELPNRQIPSFQVVLLTNREMNLDVVRGRNDCAVIERTDAPTAEQVAVVWVNDEGEAPEVKGFWLCDKKGKMSELRSSLPQLDPCCFPILHPRGTPGWRWFLPKCRGKKPSNKEQQAEAQMQMDLDEAREIELLDEPGTSMDEVEDEFLDEIQAGLSEYQPGTSAQNDHVDESPVETEDLHQLDNGEEESPWDADEANLVVGAEEEVSFIVSNDSVVEADAEVTLACNEPKTKRSISQRQFYRYRMAMREDSRGTFHWLWFARRLAEFFVISVLNRIERNELNHVKEEQKKRNLRSILASDYIDALEKGLKRLGPNRKLGWVFQTPQTFAGSKQYYQKRYADLMTVVRKIGNPTWFVTFTGNPNWPEIVGALKPGQSYHHRPDIVCRVFMDKVEEFVKDLVVRNVLGNIAGWCYSVEHQKRGMPHIHMLLILKKDARIITPDNVDEYVSARIPALPPIDDLTPAANQQRRYWHYVTSCMLHSCSKACQKDGRGCTKHFPKPFSDRTEISEVRYTNYIRVPPDDPDQPNAEADPPNAQVDTLEEDDEDFVPSIDIERDHGECRYRRIPPRDRQPARTYEQCGQTYWRKCRGNVFELLDDSRVVSHNKFLLLKYGCHINIEYVFGQKACKYIFKYLLKGFEKAYVQVHQPRRGTTEEIFDYDEIAATFKVRYMTAMEAMLRLYSYKIVNMKHQIYSLSVHDENGQTIVLEEGQEEEGRGQIAKDTRLTAFFNLCWEDAEARQHTYEQLPYFYSWQQRTRTWKKRKHPLEQDPAKARMFVRIYTVSPKKQELYAIRVLLLNRPGPTGFSALKTVGDITFTTYTEAAQHLGLLDSDDHFVRAMQDACVEKPSLKRLHHYFAMLIFHGLPSNSQQLFDQFLDEMNPPVCSNDPKFRPKTVERRRGEVLKNVEYYLRCMGSSCGEMQLHGLPVDYHHEDQAEALEAEDLWDDFFGGEKDRRKTPQEVASEQISRLNADQLAAFNQIEKAILGLDDQRCFFIEGDGGCGKTFLYNTIIRWCLAGKPAVGVNQGERTLKRGSVISAASTGIAALLLIGGSTVHRQFYVPNDVDDTIVSKVSVESAKGQLLRSADVIIIDEISMLSNKILRYLDRMLRDVCSLDKPFGGKVMVLGGDWKQLTPVVEHGTREDQVGESIKLDKLFAENFQKISLKINMRTAPSEGLLRKWLSIIGNGIHQVGAKKGREHLLEVPEETVSQKLDDVIDFCFPPQLFDDPIPHAKLIADNAILCPRNVDVEYINDIAIQRMHGDLKVFPSIDEPLDPADDHTGFRSDFNIETLNNEWPSGFPPHLLKLKVGAPIMLIRNLDVAHGLCNGTRMQIMKISDENLYCRILAGPRADAQTTYIIPRVKFQYGRGKNQRGVRFQRKQFPVRACFAMTVNKSQGQTLKKMALVLNGKQCFSHGQVYVAMSRVTTMEGIRIFSPNTCRGGQNFIENIVYQELLDNQILPMPQHPDVEENEVVEEQFLLEADILDFEIDPLPDDFDDFFD